MKRWCFRLIAVAIVWVIMIAGNEALAQGRHTSIDSPRGPERYERSASSFQGQSEHRDRSYRDNREHPSYSRDNRSSYQGSREKSDFGERNLRNREPSLEKDYSRHSNHIHSLPKARRH